MKAFLITVAAVAVGVTIVMVAMHMWNKNAPASSNTAAPGAAPAATK